MAWHEGHKCLKPAVTKAITSRPERVKSVLYTLQHFLEIHVVYAFEEIMPVLLTVTSSFHDAYQSAQRFSSCAFVWFDGDNKVT